MEVLVLDQKVALLDTSLLDIIVDKLGKKSSLQRKDETVCNYYIIDTSVAFTEVLTWHHKRVNEMCKMARFKGYQFLVIVNC